LPRDRDERVEALRDLGEERPVDGGDRLRQGRNPCGALAPTAFLAGAERPPNGIGVAHAHLLVGFKGGISVKSRTPPSANAH
jgi:hypothetical protein